MALWICGGVALLLLAIAAKPLPSPESVRPVEVARTNDYSEGVVVDREGNLYFSRPSAGLIIKVDRDGKATEWARTTAPNGHKILPNGEHLVCDGARHAVVRFDPTGREIGIAATGESGSLEIRSPNDLTLDPRGGFYFSDSVAKTGAVHYVGADGRKRCVAKNIDFANGIALSRDRRRLCVAESRKNRILVLKMDSPGSPAGPAEVFGDLPANKERPGVEDNQPDGIAFDMEGRLWVAHYGMKAVQVLSPEGKLLATYDGGNRTTSNLCFAGRDRSQLFVTGGEPGALFRLDVGIQGVNLIPGSS